MPSPWAQSLAQERHAVAMSAVRNVEMTGRTPGLHNVCPGCGQCQDEHPGRYRPATHLDGCPQAADTVETTTTEETR